MKFQRNLEGLVRIHMVVINNIPIFRPKVSAVNN